MATAWDEYQEMVRDEMGNVYSETVIYHAMNLRNMANMSAANGYASRATNIFLPSY